MRQFKFIFLATAASIFMISCSEDNGPGPDPDPEPDNVLEGAITSNISLDVAIAYTLRGSVTVEDGATLTIPAGTTITADASDGLDALIVKQGGRINASGEANNPIVFTSASMETGSWGGIVILGRAPINVTGGTSSPEFDNSLTYGGTTENDNSGTLSYIRVEYAGAGIIEGSVEYNGFGFYGVGSGTVVNNLETYKGSDDGFEWFGGTVVANNLISIGDEDDSFDTAEGWTGGGSNWIAIKDGNGDNGFEWDNNENDNAATPMSNPTVSDITLIGTGANDGMRLRRGTAGTITNVVIRNFSEGIDIRDAVTVDNALSGDLIIDGVLFDAIEGDSYDNDQAQDISGAITEDPSATGADDAFASGWSRYDMEGWGDN